MTKPISLFIGLRYIRAKRRSHFISFISLASMLGMALGIIVLITVLSVMNGFDREIKKKIFDLTPQVTITSYDASQLVPWKPIGEKALTLPDVKGFSPFLNGQGMLTQDDTVSPILVRGIMPKYENDLSGIKEHFIEGGFERLKPGEFGIVLGDALAAQFNLVLGDKVNLLTADGIVSPVGFMPTIKAFTLVGVFHVGSIAQIDNSLAYIHLNDAQALFQKRDDITGINLKVKGLFDAPKVSYQVKQLLGPDYLISNWTEEHAAYFHAIKNEKIMMFVLLLFIVAVAMFNLVSTLVMVVTDKRSEIAILKTIGATPGTIMRIFMFQGSIIGLIGIVLGTIGGIALSLNISKIVRAIEQLFQTEFVSPSFYYVDFLPSKLLMSDVVTVCALTFLMTLLATLYPAWQASRTQPAEALRYE